MADPAGPVPAQTVGEVFVSQYYCILHKSPGLAHRFYQDISRVGRPEEDGKMSTTTTLEAINTKLLSLNRGVSRVEVKHVDAQESLCGGVHVLVTGFLSVKDDIPKSFSQSFFLAPQEEGYFVLNDIFRYTESASRQENANHHKEERAPTQAVVSPVTPVQARETAPAVEKNMLEDAASSTKESQVKEVLDAAVSTEESRVSEVVDEVQDSWELLAVESNTKVEDQPKKSYAAKHYLHRFIDFAKSLQ